MKTQRPHKSKGMLNKKSNARDITILNLKLYFTHTCTYTQKHTDRHTHTHTQAKQQQQQQQHSSRVLVQRCRYTEEKLERNDLPA